MMVERRGEIGCRISIVEILLPAWLAAIGMDQCVAENLEIVRVDEPARRPGHVRLPVHGRKCGDVSKGADRLCLVLREMRLTAVLDDLYAVRVRNLDNLVDLGSIAGRINASYTHNSSAKRIALS